MAGSTPNMGLRQWNLSTDFFEYGNLSANWTKLDLHDHTTGKGLQIPTAGLQNLAVTQAKIADLAVIQAKIALLAVGTGQLQDDAVTAAKLADNAVLAANILDGVVNSAKIQDGTIALGDLATTTQNSFLKLLVAADKKASFGTYTASFAGTGVFGDSASIPHGLPSTPDKVLFFQRSSSADSVWGGAWCKTKDATNFVARHVAVVSTIAPNYDIVFDWIAIS